MICASITGVGSESTVPSNPRAVDAEIWASNVPGRGELLGEVTLLPDRQTGEHSPWGNSLDYWANDALAAHIEAHEDRATAIREITAAVRDAIVCEGVFNDR